MLLLFLCIVWLFHGVAFAQWTEPVIDGSLRSGPLAPPPVTGTTFYVDEAGLGGTCNNANPGTQSQPWCTIGKALATLTAGQAALVRTATYTEGNLRPTNSGSAGNYMTLRAYPGDSPIIDCVGRTWCFDGFSANARSYFVVDGFEMKNSSQQILSCWNSSGCHHWWLVNNTIHDNSPTHAGLEFEASNIVVSNNEIYNIGRTGMYSGTAGWSNHIFEFNLLYDIGRNGDDDGVIKCGVQSWACVIRYNIAYNNYRNPGSSVPCFNPGNCQGMTAYYADFQEDTAQGTLSYIYNNIAHDNDIGIQVWASQGIRVFNNIVYHNGFTPGAATFINQFGEGLTVNAAETTNVELYNNLVYDNAKFGLKIHTAAQTCCTLRNNIIMNNNGSSPDVFIGHGAANGNYNYDLIVDSAHGGNVINWNGTNYASVGAFQARGGNTTWLNALSTAPTFVSAGTGNFQMQSGSAGINQGTTVALFTYDYSNILRPQGGIWDIGPYEFGTLSAPPTVTITVPTSGTTHSTSTSPLTVGGSASDDVGVTVTVACSPACGSPSVAGTTSWSASVPFQSGDNVITATASDADLQTVQDVLTVTYTPPVAGTTSPVAPGFSGFWAR